MYNILSIGRANVFVTPCLHGDQCKWQSTNGIYCVWHKHALIQAKYCRRMLVFVAYDRPWKDNIIRFRLGKYVVDYNWMLTQKHFFKWKLKNLCLSNNKKLIAWRCITYYLKVYNFWNVCKLRVSNVCQKIITQSWKTMCIKFIF